MLIRYFSPKSARAFGLFGILGLLSANPVMSASLLLDSFDAPAPRESIVVTVAGDFDTPGVAGEIQTSTPAVPGGVREAFLHVYNNPLSSASVLQVGEGNLSVAQGTGAMAETLITYGAFTRPTGDPHVGGPLLGLDLSGYNALKFDFSGVEDWLNVNVVFYTAVPLNPLTPLFYSQSGINIVPAVPGGPLSFTLGVSNNADFNWHQVDGVVVEINRSGPIPSTSYTLDRLSFETITPVPEPQTWVLLLAGLSALMLFRRRDS
ncbi:MAG: PEP-CTERM sorting domain-containing protein [Gammaproteobacteria bacterium]|nr:MAG: PEP-CTERM sorting domain-containing protein [Gammaproteobacteria bacterium]